MRILLIGKNDFFRQRVLEFLLAANHDVFLLVEQEIHYESYQHSGVHAILGTASENGPWMDKLPRELDAVINVYLPKLEKRITQKSIDEVVAPEMVRIVHNTIFAAQKTSAKKIINTSFINYFATVGDAPVSEHATANTSGQGFASIDVQKIHVLRGQTFPTTTLLFGFLYNRENVWPQVPLLLSKTHAVIGSGDNKLQLTHVDDAAGVINFLLENPITQPLLNVVDNIPVYQKDFIKVVSRIENFTSPIKIPAPIGSIIFGDALARKYSESVCAKNDLLRSLGYWLKFPDYHAGLNTATLG